MTLLYAKILKKAGFDCKLVIQYKPGERSNAKILDFLPSNLPCIELECRYRYCFFYLFKILKQEKPDIIFCSMPDFVRLLAFFKILHLYKNKLVLRCMNTPSKADKSLYRVLRIWYPHADAIISQTKEMAEELVSYCGLDTNKIITINNPVDKELIASKVRETHLYDHSYVNYLGIGRIAPGKNFGNLIQAFTIVLQKEPRSRLYIVGSWSNVEETQKIVKIIEANKLSDKVFLEGYQSNPYKYLKSCDCFVLSSDFEGLPNVMLEAMYLGKPVAATTCIPYVAQVIHDGENGFTCPVKNPYLLAEAMQKTRLLKDLPEYNDINHSEEKVKKFFKSLLN